MFHKSLTIDAYLIFINMTKDVLQWNPEKNQTLKEERGVSFEDVEVAFRTGAHIDDIPHPNQRKYPNRHMLIVEIDGYICAVPYARNGDIRFLKTIFKSRKLKSKYTNRDKHD